MRLKAIKGEKGVTAIELMVVAALFVLLSGLSVKPITGLVQRIRLQNAADGIKHYILNARVRAVSNPDRHCGVVIIVHASKAIDDTVLAFLDKKPGDNLYKPAEDAKYLSPYVIKKSKTNIIPSLPAGFPSVIVFRADGSANASAKLVLTMNNFQDTISVLASTGKVRVGVK